MKLNKRFFALLLTLLLLVASFAGCAKEQKAVKVALLCSGPINDGGWNTEAYNAVMKLKETHGWETTYTENVVAADIPSTLRNYAQNGYTLIYGNGYEYGDYMLEVAKEFPDTCFFSICGVVNNDKNMGSGLFRYYELGYLCGELAARMTKTGKVGFVGAMETPGILAEVSAFKHTVEEKVAGSNVSVAYTGSWTDVAKGYEAAVAQINAGCDILMGIGDACDAGAIQACQESNGKAKFIGFASDMNYIAPDVVITSAVQSTPFMIAQVADQFAAGKFPAAVTEYNIANGGQYFGVWAEDVDATIKQEILDLEKSIKDGTLVLDTSKWQ
ncbi:MAG: BMP family protein [Bacillota bacterium]